MSESLLDDILDFGVRDWGAVGERIDGTSGGDGVKEWLRHICFVIVGGGREGGFVGVGEWIGEHR